MKAQYITDILNDKGQAIASGEDVKTFLRITADEYIRQAIAEDVEDVGVIIDDIVAMIRLIDKEDWEWVYIEENPMSVSNLHIMEAGKKA